jgi:hypothetical protein
MVSLLPTVVLSSRLDFISEFATDHYGCNPLLTNHILRHLGQALTTAIGGQTNFVCIRKVEATLTFFFIACYNLQYM